MALTNRFVEDVVVHVRELPEVGIGEDGRVINLPQVRDEQGSSFSILNQCCCSYTFFRSRRDQWLFFFLWKFEEAKA